MPKRTDITSVLIIGAGPIIIGQACEFDYSGAQACKALKEEGYRVILVNSNPATIMTDPGMADATYIEPITLDILERVIAPWHPDFRHSGRNARSAINLISVISVSPLCSLCPNPRQSRSLGRRLARRRPVLRSSSPAGAEGG